MPTSYAMLESIRGGAPRQPEPRRAKAEVVFVGDVRTYRSGAHDDTLCHIVGGGPVPSDVVREMAKDSFLRVVFHAAVNIHTVTHAGALHPRRAAHRLGVG